MHRSNLQQGQYPTAKSTLPFHSITCMLKACELSVCMCFQTFRTNCRSETVLNCSPRIWIIFGWNSVLEWTHNSVDEADNVVLFAWFYTPRRASRRQSYVCLILLTRSDWVNFVWGFFCFFSSFFCVSTMSN